MTSNYEDTAVIYGSLVIKQLLALKTGSWKTNKLDFDTYTEGMMINEIKFHARMAASAAMAASDVT